MEPRIQYAKTSDGVSIAFTTLGRGEPPLVVTPANPLFGLQLEWQVPGLRRLNERLAGKRMVVRYDSRGCGLSERNATSFTLDDLSQDLEAVVDHLRLEKFSLLAELHLGPPAVAYAIAHPERISHLVLWNSYARGADYWAVPQNRAYLAMRQAGEWQIYTEAISRLFFGTPEFGALIRESTTPELYGSFIDATVGFDVNRLLPEVRCPTLVLHTPAMALTTLDISRALASHIPGARLVVVEGGLEGGSDAMAEAIDEFLDEGEEAAVGVEPSEPGGFRTILFTDIEGSTALTQRLGDAKAREVLREHERIVREALAAHGGSEVKTMGDGFMASFGSATKALECAIAIQRAFAERNASLPAHPVAKGDSPGREPVEGRAEPQPSAHPFDSAQDRASTGSARADRDVGVPTEAIRVRIGLNAGEPIAEEDPDGRGDLFGTAVIAAARIAAQAKGGEILVSNVVRELVAGKGFLFSARGKTALRGFDDPVEVYEVRWRPFDSPSASAAGGSG
jgi:class 3 adenylate cyclase